ncbi:MAG: zinc ribbon domain-containing protein [Treponema sp.]|jgi:putative FmdB family regulatory protein|nr:zinc ribbon domain-containing protein [Treponema sp.]
MPTYEYQCKTCSYTFEAFQSMSDAPLKVCPECGKEIRRLINGGSGIIFKGSGFYVTDKGAGGSKANAAKNQNKPSAPAAGGEKSAPAAGNEKSASTAHGSGGEKAPSSPGSSEKKAAG